MNIKSIFLSVLISGLLFAGCTNWEKEAQAPIEEADAAMIVARGFLDDWIASRELWSAYNSLISAKLSVDINESEENYKNFLDQLATVETTAKVDLQKDRKYFSNAFETGAYQYNARQVEAFYKAYSDELTRLTDVVKKHKTNSFHSYKMAYDGYTTAIGFLEKSKNEERLKEIIQKKIEANFILAQFHINSNNKEEVIKCYEELAVDFERVGNTQAAQESRDIVAKLKG